MLEEQEKKLSDFHNRFLQDEINKSKREFEQQRKKNETQLL